MALSLGRPVAELRALMDELIAEWKRQAGDVLYKYGYESPEGLVLASLASTSSIPCLPPD